ncbi:MAG: rod shape-determining protein MreC [Flavobacteriaceae bacterium]
MQRIINALVQFRNPILFFLLLGVSFFFLNSNSNFHRNKIEKYGLYVSSRINKLSSKFTDYFSLVEANQKLIQENTALKKLELESNALPLYPSALNDIGRFPYSIKSAKVIQNNVLGLRNYIIIDQGSADGIKPEMAVLSQRGILGIVKSVSKHYASLISILHLDLKINVRLKNRADFGSLTWSGKSPSEFKIEGVISSAPVAVGDTVITGGMSSYFPMGIPLGRIKKMETLPTSGYHDLTVELFKDPSQAYFAYVIKNEYQDEIEKLKSELNR